MIHDDIMLMLPPHSPVKGEEGVWGGCGEVYLSQQLTNLAKLSTSNFSSDFASLYQPLHSLCVIIHRHTATIT